MLVQQALEDGAYIGKAAEVVQIDESVIPYNVVLRDGRRIVADVVVGADGAESKLRTNVVDKPFPVKETGHTMFYAHFTLEQLRRLNNPDLESIIGRPRKTVWLGPEKHVVAFPLRQDEELSMQLW